MPRKIKPLTETQKEKARQRAKAWYHANAEYSKAKNLEWQAKNRDKVRAWSARWKKANSDVERARHARRKKEHPEIFAALENKRRASKKNACPVWTDLEAIKSLYKEAAERTRSTGIKHHVDHIVPLRGEFVSGLHVPANLQILTAAENMKKHNNFEIA